MSTLRLIRYFAWAAVALVALLAGTLAVGWYASTGPGGPVQTANVGGAFSMTDETGRRVTEADLIGKPSLVFFGFTACPDVCPTTLLEASGWLDAIGEDADRINMVFVSVDPDRDTPETMAQYLEPFDERIIGLTGTAEEVAGIAKAYRVYYRKVEIEGGYTVDHTASVFLMDADGRFVGTIAYQEAEETALAKIKRLLAA